MSLNNLSCEFPVGVTYSNIVSDGVGNLHKVEHQSIGFGGYLSTSTKLNHQDIDELAEPVEEELVEINSYLSKNKKRQHLTQDDWERRNSNTRGYIYAGLSALFTVGAAGGVCLLGIKEEFTIAQTALPTIVTGTLAFSSALLLDRWQNSRIETIVEAKIKKKDLEAALTYYRNAQKLVDTPLPQREMRMGGL